MGKELELKLRAASAEQLQQILRWSGFDGLRTGEDAVLQMQSVYYDTPERLLALKKWTLRRRTENERSVICLKTPIRPVAGLKARGEWELTGSDVARALPELVALGAPPELPALFEGASPQPVCGARFTRQAVQLRLPDESVCELACDAGVLLGRDRELPFFEVELELKRGEVTQMLRLARQLCDAFSLRREPKSKFARALALASE